jgi:predicted dehydrogenase
VTALREIRAGVIGFGWMGQAHSRSLARSGTVFSDSPYRPRLTVCADSDPTRRDLAAQRFGFDRAVGDWKELVASPDVDAVWVTAPNMLHLEVIQAAAAAGKAVFCEKPVGGTPQQTVQAEAAARAAGVTSGVGYNYRWAPLVQHTKRLLEAGVIGDVVHYRGSFFSVYGADPLGRLSWRYLVDQGGYGVTSDLLSHAVDLAQFLVGPVSEVSATTETFITDRPLPSAGGTHYDRGAADDPTGSVTNEDYVGVLARFASGARATFESCRTFVGPESENTFTIYGTRGAISWNLERLNQLQVYVDDAPDRRGWTTINGGDRFPYHGAFVPGDANGIGFEDIIAIEDHEFCLALAEERPFQPSFEDALAWVGVQDAILRSARSRSWEPVMDLREAAAPAPPAGGSAGQVAAAGHA